MHVIEPTKKTKEYLLLFQEHVFRGHYNYKLASVIPI